MPALHTRIRRRRTEKGLTGAELAQRASISPSYVSLIENGAKVPDEDASARLARALDDDESLYRAWARAARFGLHDLAILNELDTIARTPGFASLVESGRELPRLAPEAAPPEDPAPSDLAARLREVAYRLDPATLAARDARSASTRHEAAAVVRIPVLAPGADPAGPEPPPAREHLLLDRKLLGDETQGALFAYEVMEADAGRLRGVAGPGDRVVLRSGGAVRTDRISAVRTAGGVRLSRALVADGLLVLLPGDGEAQFELVPLCGRDPSSLVAGTHVLLLRR
jgi:transcriptional regulator with XRE-family HTH domain